jgi:GAF domain-containing protein
MAYQQLSQHYSKGKQIICMLAILLSIAGFIFDAITYHAIYSESQVWLQVSTTLLCVLSLVLVIVNRSKYYVVSFGILSYGIIFNIILTTVYIHTFLSFENFTQANILSRDIFFVTFYIVLSGFIIGRNHIFIQGSMLIGLVLYFIFILKEPFFLANAAIYLTASISFSLVMYFFVGTLNSLIKGLEESTKVAHDLKQEETFKKQTLIEYQNSLLRIAQDESLFKNNLNHLFSKICDMAAHDLKISRVSIWILEENNTRLVRKQLHEIGGSKTESATLLRNDFPGYFSALETHPFVAAEVAADHPDTREFKDVYLKPLEIVSMLDCPIVVDSKPVGVICCENQYTQKNWTSEDVLFVQSLSVHISICYKNLLINDLLNQVQQRNVDLIEKGNEIEAMNEELNSLNEELLTLNDSLEATVKRRTQELETQNQQLTEYAFINSHILRAPLARILGLAQLIASEAETIKDKQLLAALITSSHELDSIIRKISDLLYDGNNLSREDIQVIINRTINKTN